MTRSKSRREVLLGAAALAGAASLPRVASAQAKGRIVVGTWGGDYARLLNKNIEAPLLIKDGWEVVQDQAGDPERRSGSPAWSCTTSQPSLISIGTSIFLLSRRA